MSTENREPVTPPSTGDRANAVDTTTTWGAANTSDASGAEQQPKPKRSAKKLAIAVAVALGIAGAGAGVVYAASGSTSSTTEQGPGGQGGMGGGPGGRSGGGPGGLMSEALHGEYVVSDGNGNYTTEILQNGEVTAISDTSITAKSEDGYTKTYTIDSDTTSDLSSIATGDDVTITATVSGDTATVETVVEEGTATGQGQMGTPPDQQSGTTQDSDSGTTSGN
jgi:hypothetical protein